MASPYSTSSASAHTSPYSSTAPLPTTSHPASHPSYPTTQPHPPSLGGYDSGPTSNADWSTTGPAGASTSMTSVYATSNPSSRHERTPSASRQETRPTSGASSVVGRSTSPGGGKGTWVPSGKVPYAKLGYPYIPSGPEGPSRSRSPSAPRTRSTSPASVAARPKPDLTVTQLSNVDMSLPPREPVSPRVTMEEAERVARKIVEEERRVALKSSEEERRVLYAALEARERELEAERERDQAERVRLDQEMHHLIDDLHNVKAECELIKRTTLSPVRYSSLTPALRRMADARTSATMNRSAALESTMQTSVSRQHSDGREVKPPILPSWSLQEWKEGLSQDGETYSADLTRLRNLNVQLEHRAREQEQLLAAVLQRGLPKDARGLAARRPVPSKAEVHDTSQVSFVSGPSAKSSASKRQPATERFLEPKTEISTSLNMSTSSLQSSSRASPARPPTYSPRPLSTVAVRPDGEAQAPEEDAPGKSAIPFGSEPGQLSYEELSTKHAESLRLLSGVTAEARSQQSIIALLLKRLGQYEHLPADIATAVASPAVAKSSSPNELLTRLREERGGLMVQIARYLRDESSRVERLTDMLERLAARLPAEEPTPTAEGTAAAMVPPYAAARPYWRATSSGSVPAHTPPEKDSQSAMRVFGV